MAARQNGMVDAITMRYEAVEAGEVEDFVFAVLAELEYWIHLIDC